MVVGRRAGFQVRLALALAHRVMLTQNRTEDELGQTSGGILATDEGLQ